MHKVKEAVTDHHEKDTVPANEPTGEMTYLSSSKIYVRWCNDADIFHIGTHNTYKSTNPYAKGPVATQHNPSTMNSEPGTGTGRGFGNHGAARGPDTYDSATTGANTTNAGPHDSKIANKLDPRVDSDLGKLEKTFLCNKIFVPTC